MKREMIKNALLFSILILFLSSGVFAVTENTCDIVDRISCDDPATEGYVVMGLSDLTNAHGELVSQGNYDYVLCCNIGAGDTTCSETNKLLGLSDVTNAHAEVPEGTTYSQEICYENFGCIYKTENCEVDEIGILSLSSTTNAHIGGIEDYNVKICCSSSGGLAGACNLETAIWNKESATEGENVRLLVTGSSSADCNGQTVSFEVEEGGIFSQGLAETQPINVAFNGNEAIGEWVAEWVEDVGTNPEYFFTAIMGSDSLESSNELKVSERSEDDCLSITTCGDYTNEDDCESDENVCDVAGNVEIPGVDCDDENTYCGCRWDDEEGCMFGFVEIVEEECGDATTGCNFGCTLCESVAEGYYCTAGSSCPIGETPGNNNGSCDFGIDGCSSEDCEDGERDTCIEPYYCSLGKCFTIEGPPAGFGSCQVTQVIESDCDEAPVGYKTVRLTGIWTGEETGSAYENCIAMGDDPLTIPCPAQIQLPFFGAYNIIIIVLVVAGIYLFLKFKKKKK